MFQEIRAFTSVCEMYGSIEAAACANPLQPFNNLSVTFLAEVSRELRKTRSIRDHSDLATLAFWCRPKRLEYLKSQYKDLTSRLGVGSVFHVSPRNVPLTFFYSYIFALLTGNSSIVRIPTVNFPQVTVLLELVEKILSTDVYNDIKDRTCFINYERDDVISADISRRVDARMIWGGDETVHTFKRFETKLRCRDLLFPNRVSVSMINANSVLRLTDNELRSLASRFCADALEFDQNACSSPRLLLWIGNDEVVSSSKELFWKEVDRSASINYPKTDSTESEKFKQNAHIVCKLMNVDLSHNKLSRIDLFELGEVDSEIEILPLMFGTFVQVSNHSPQNALRNLSEKYQTLTYFGFERDEVRLAVNQSGSRGIDRVVPIGSALEMGLYWDGYDVVSQLTRRVEVL